MSAIIKLKHYIEKTDQLTTLEKKRLLQKLEQFVIEEQNDVIEFDRIENNCIIIKSKI